MPSNYEVVDHSKEQNPMLGLIGFIMIVVVAGLSYLISIPLTGYLKRAHVVLGASGLNVLPLRFPDGWSLLGQQLAVSAGLFLVLFVISMVILFMFMKPASQDEQSVNLDVLRKEAEARKKRR